MIGRPPKYKSPEELQEAIDAYFELTDKPTISGLALALGFESRQSFYDYEQGDFSYTIKRARLQIEAVYEQKLHGAQCTGAIFALKNFGWTDKTEVEQTGTVTNIQVTVDTDKTAEELRRLINGSKAD
jgi:hypothetical protein